MKVKRRMTMYNSFLLTDNILLTGPSSQSSAVIARYHCY